ncbi:MAG: hypothetical protein KDB68_08860 [Planctomycetes bacterium]|nr:hypothetical protein [Planctomycetota bacterium]
MKNSPRYDFVHERRLRYFVVLFPILALGIVIASIVVCQLAMVGALLILADDGGLAAPSPVSMLVGLFGGGLLGMYFVLRIVRRVTTCPHRRKKPVLRELIRNYGVIRLDKFDACPLCSGPAPRESEPLRAINVPYGQKVE